MLAFLTATAIGLRSSLLLLALGVCLAWSRAPRESEPADQWGNAATGLLGLGVSLFAPIYLGPLIGIRLPPIVSRLDEAVAALVMCMALIAVQATRALRKGVSIAHVRQRIMANACVVAGLLVCAWVFGK